MRRWGIITGIAAILLALLLFTIAKRGVPGSLSRTHPTPTPSDPFFSLTIPYLRSRTYESTLGERAVFERHASYTSYLASYHSDGLRINALLTVPTGSEPEGGFPAIVFVHGYIPPTEYRTTERYAAYVDALAKNGFVVLKIDLRGHGDSEGQATGSYYSSGYVIDALNARAALAASDFVNPLRIGMWGHSMAGNIVMRAFAAVPSIPAVAIWAGAGYTYEDLITYRLNDLSYRPPTTVTLRQGERERLRTTHGEFRADDPFWRQVAVTTYLPELRGAIEIHHAVDDTVVSVEYSRNLMKLLDETAVPHQLFEYPSGGHNISGSSFGVAMDRTVSFFREHLK